MKKTERVRDKSADKKNSYRRSTSLLSVTNLSSRTPAQLNGAIPGRLVVLKPESTFKLRDPLSPIYSGNSLPLRDSSSRSNNYTTRDRAPVRSFSANSYDGLIKPDSLRRRYPSRYSPYSKRGISKICCSVARSKRPSVCLVPLVFGIGILGVFALYFGLRGFSTSEKPFEKVFRGAFKVTNGDTYSPKLSDPTSEQFQSKAQKYEMHIENVLQEGMMKDSAVHAEVVSFGRDESNSLTVNFNLYVDTRNSPAKAEEIHKALEGSLTQFSLSSNRTGKAMIEGLKVDPTSLEIKDRNFGAMVEGFPRTLAKHPPSLYHNRFHKDIDGAETKNKGSQFKKACSPVTLPFCKGLGYNFTSFPNLVGFQTPREIEKIQEAAMLLVNSRCSPHIKDVLCFMLQPPCDQRLRKAKQLCRKTCQEVAASCSADALNSPLRRTHLPTTQLYRINNEVSQAVKEFLQCDALPKDDSKCIASSGVPVSVRNRQPPSDECLGELKAKKLESRVCDGVMDCADFTDEVECDYCPPGFVHCGVGKTCVDPKRRCDGVNDCPNGSDERACLSIAPSMEAASYVHQYFNDGYMIFYEGEKMGKICIDSMNQTYSADNFKSFLQIFGEATCKQLSYRYMVDISAVYDDDRDASEKYAELSETGGWRATFMKMPCYSSAVLRLKCAELECGIRPIFMKHPPRTVNARSATENPVTTLRAVHGDWPWHVLLLKDGIHVCDGTLISDVWILTSQSCFENSPRANWIARFASVRTSSLSPWEQEKAVVGMVRSPLPGSGIVLAKLDSPVIFSDFVRPSCLGYEGMRLDRNTRCVVLTWNNQGEELHEDSVRLTSPEMCMSAGRTNSSKILSMCAETTGSSRSCKNEIFNGAPLLCQESHQGAWSLVGVATSYLRCRPGIREPTMFTGKPYESVALLADWVVRTIRVTRPISS